MRKALLSLSAGLVLIGLYALGLAQQEEPKKKRRDEPIVPAAALPVVDGAGLSDGKSYDTQPAACTSADGTTHIAWVRYRNRVADELVAAAVRGGKAEAPVAITPEKGQYIRPAVAAAGADVWCVWTRTEPENVASIWMSKRSGGGWSAPERFLAGETRSHQNPEIAATADGRVAVAYQVHTGRATTSTCGCSTARRGPSRSR